MSPLPSGETRTARIRDLNDQFRELAAPHLGQVMFTIGVRSLPVMDQLIILRLVSSFDEFTPDNDPHGEHDFGAIEYEGVRYFWKIDYYDLAMEFHSPDPSEPDLTCRVITIMRADEY